MAEFIDLISSTPPHPHGTPRRVSPTKTTPNPPSSGLSRSNFFSSDGIDSSLLAFDDDSNKPAKRRRLSDQSPRLLSANSSRAIDPLFTFSDEDPIVASSISASAGVGSNVNKHSDWKGDGSDPIVFTSSAPEPGSKTTVSRYTGNNNKDSAIITIDDDNSDIDDGGHSRRPRDSIEDSPGLLPASELDHFIGYSESSLCVAGNGLSRKTTNLLASLENRSKTPSGVIDRSSKAKGKGRAGKELDYDLSDGLDEPAKPPKKTSKISTAQKEAKARDRAAMNAQKEAKARERAAVNAQKTRERTREGAETETKRGEGSREAVGC